LWNNPARLWRDPARLWRNPTRAGENRTGCNGCRSGRRPIATSSIRISAIGFIATAIATAAVWISAVGFIAAAIAAPAIGIGAIGFIAAAVSTSSIGISAVSFIAAAPAVWIVARRFVSTLAHRQLLSFASVRVKLFNLDDLARGFVYGVNVLFQLSSFLWALSFLRPIFTASFFALRRRFISHKLISSFQYDGLTLPQQCSHLPLTQSDLPIGNRSKL
jgi:hypothetical protein